MQTHTFSDLPLSDEVRSALALMDFHTPTDVQLAAFGPASEGRDLVVQARTGTGKTVAFGLPMIDRIVDPALAEPQALVLVPTRELALQCKKELEKLAIHKNLRVAAIYGGAGIVGQEEALAQGVHIVSATPGRALDLMSRGSLKFSALKLLVLDEADEMLSMGFAKELNEIAQRLPSKRQTFFFSATLDEAIQRTSDKFLSDPVRLSLSSDEIGARTIQHFIYHVSGMHKAADLCRILDTEEPESAIIFCNTKVATDSLANFLSSEGYVAESLNGDLPQSERERVLLRTRRSELRYLVATDVAARGIDISHLTHVVNYDFPEAVESYVHRTGRTGRAGKTGTAISLITPQDLSALYMLRLSYKISPIEKPLPNVSGLDATVESRLLTDWAEKPASELHALLARRVLSHDDSERIVASLLRQALGAVDNGAERKARRSRLPPQTEAYRQEAQAEQIASTGTNGRERRSRSPRAAEQSSEREPAPVRTSAVHREASKTPERDSSEASTTSTMQHSVANGDFVDLFVSVGRRDNIQNDELLQFLEQESGVARAEFAKIRMRDRHSFVQLGRQHVDAVIAAISGKTLGERVVSAELSRRDQTAS